MVSLQQKIFQNGHSFSLHFFIKIFWQKVFINFEAILNCGKQRLTGLHHHWLETLNSFLYHKNYLISVILGKEVSYQNKND